MKISMLSLSLFLPVILAACGSGNLAFRSDDAGTAGGSTGIFIPSTSSTVTTNPPDAGSTCSPVSCEDLGYTCGSADNGCNKAINCGQCAAASPVFCLKNNCTLSNCASALEDPSKIGVLSGADASSYQSVLQCVCHNTQTTETCGADANSIAMCGNGMVTWDFLINDSIGVCAAQFCVETILACRGAV